MNQNILIILGGIEINYFGGERDTMVKTWLVKLPITLFCIHAERWLLGWGKKALHRFALFKKRLGKTNVGTLHCTDIVL